MSDAIPSAEARFEAALTLCADDLGVPREAVALRGSPGGAHYKSQVRFVGTSERTTHVVKLDVPPYDPHAERAALDALKAAEENAESGDERQP